MWNRSFKWQNQSESERLWSEGDDKNEYVREWLIVCSVCIDNWTKYQQIQLKIKPNRTVKSDLTMLECPVRFNSLVDDKISATLPDKNEAISSKMKQIE